MQRQSVSSVEGNTQQTTADVKQPSKCKKLKEVVLPEQPKRQGYEQSVVQRHATRDSKLYSQATSNKIKTKAQPTENPQKIKYYATLQAIMDKMDNIDNSLTKLDERLTKLEYSTKGAILKNKK